MRPSRSLDRLDTVFDDDRLVANAELLLPATLAHRLGLRQLVDRYLDLGSRPVAANTGDKFLTLVPSALAGVTASTMRTAYEPEAPSGSWAFA